MAEPVPFDCTFVTRPQGRVGGDYFHRTYWPAAALGDHLPTTALQLSHPNCLDAMATTGLLVVTMVMEPDLLPVFERRRARHLPTIYEISDDFEAVPDNLPLHEFYAQPWVRDLARELCQKADAVQFSSPGLARKYGHLNPVHRVFHNQAWDVPALHERAARQPGAPLRVGWAGMAGHLEDCPDFAQFLRPSFGKDAAEPFDSARLNLKVMTTPRIAEALSNAGITFSWQAPGPMQEYLRFLEGVDIGLAHTAESDFARSRSDGKFIEYASCGVVAVCCQRGTYAETVRDGDTGLLYTTPERLRQCLDALSQTPSLRSALRASAHAELSSTRNHRAAATERLAFYREIESCARAQRDPARPAGRSSLAPAGGFFHAIHDIEEELQVALMQHRNNPGPELLQTYWQLAQRAPDFYRIWEAMFKLYRELGLTESLAALDNRTRQQKQLAFERAFGSA